MPTQLGLYDRLVVLGFPSLVGYIADDTRKYVGLPPILPKY